MQELRALPQQPLVPWLAAWAAAEQRGAEVPVSPRGLAAGAEALPALAVPAAVRAWLPVGAVPRERRAEVESPRGLPAGAEALPVLAVPAAARAWLPAAPVREPALQQQAGPEVARTQGVPSALAGIPRELPSRSGFPSLKLRRRVGLSWLWGVSSRALPHSVQSPPMAMMACPRSLQPSPWAWARQAWSERCLRERPQPKRAAVRRAFPAWHLRVEAAS
jgi:hypothetical protein